MDRTGLVIKSTGKWYKVRMEDGDVVDAQIRGKFRIQGLKTTNPLAVGDHVTLEEEKDETWVINTILERKNYIIRKYENPRSIDFFDVLTNTHLIDVALYDVTI